MQVWDECSFNVGKDKIFNTEMGNQSRRVEIPTSLTFRSHDLSFRFHEATPLLQQVLEKIPFCSFGLFLFPYQVK